MTMVPALATAAHRVLGAAADPVLTAPAERVLATAAAPPLAAADPALPSAAEVERALADVFARPELAPRPPSVLGRWIGAVWDRITELLTSHLPRLDVSEGSQRLIYWLLIGAMIAAVVVIAIHLLAAAAGAWRGRERRGGRGAGAPAEGGAAGPAGAEAWEARARAATAAGRWRDAAHALYQALVLRLDDAGVVRYDSAKTPGDYRREARREPAAHRALDAFLGFFEPIAFGSRPVDEAGYALLRAAAAEAGAHG